MRLIKTCFLALILFAAPSTAKAVIILDFPEITATPGMVTGTVTVFGSTEFDQLQLGIGVDQVIGDLSNSLTIYNVDPNVHPETIWTDATRNFGPPGPGGTTAGVTINNKDGIDTSGDGIAATITFNGTMTEPGDVFLINLNELGFTKAFKDGIEVPIMTTGIGSITMVPEPSAFLYLGLVGLGYVGVKRLRRKRS